MELSFFHQFNRFIAGSGIRHLVHIKDLIYGQAQNISDDGLLLLYLYFGKAVDSVIELNAAFHGALDKAH